MRLSPPPVGYKPEYLDLNHNSRPDATKSITHNDISVLWLDDDNNLEEGDWESGTVNDYLLIDRNRDGIYGDQRGLITNWVDTDNDGRANMQFIIECPKERTSEVWPNGHYMTMSDLDRDNIFSYISWNNLTLQCWEHKGSSDSYEDYSRRASFLKIHTSTYDVEDLCFNWKNPFLFYGPDSDNRTEMATRLVNSPRTHDPNSPSNNYMDHQLEGRIDWTSLAVNTDNDNTTNNEFDLDFTIGFQGKGLDYTDQIHPIRNLRGVSEANCFSMDLHYR